MSTPLLTDEELKILAKDMVEGRVFSSDHIPEEQASLLPSIFMVLGLMNKEQREGLKGVALVYEYIEKAVPSIINGYPCFSSLRTVHDEQYKQLGIYINDYLELTKEYREGG